MTWVKICGIKTVHDAMAVSRAGVTAVGLNMFAQSRRFIDTHNARSISMALAEAHPEVGRVGVLVDLPGGVGAYMEVGRKALLTDLQLHGDESEELVEELCDRGWSVIKAIRVRTGEGADDVSERIESYIDASDGRCRVLLDAWVKGKPGGTGRRIDAGLLRELLSRHPLIVAGGLTPTNVADIFKLAPLSDGTSPGITGVDVASGVEGPNGRKDITLVRRFMAACRI